MYGIYTLDGIRYNKREGDREGGSTGMRHAAAYGLR